MAGKELALTEQWLYGRLAADAALIAEVGGALATRIYADVAPLGTASPWVVFQLQTPQADTRGVGNVRILTNGQYLVRGIAASTDLTRLDTIAERIDALLNHVQGAITGLTVVASYRIRPFRLTEIVDGVSYLHLGGLYQLLVQ